MWIWAIVAILGVAVIGGGIYLLTRKPVAPAPPYQAPQQQQQAPPTAPPPIPTQTNETAADLAAAGSLLGPLIQGATQIGLAFI